MSAPQEPLWDYWCPPEGTYVFAPNELWVGAVTVDDEGVGHPLFVVAVFPPIPTDPPTQPEGLAVLLRDALVNAPHLIDRDGLADWCSAHGFAIRWPRVVEAIVGTPEGTEG